MKERRCPSCCKKTKFIHTHQTYYGGAGHVPGSERFICLGCGYRLHGDEVFQANLEYRYDEIEVTTVGAFFPNGHDSRNDPINEETGVLLRGLYDTEEEERVH